MPEMLRYVGARFTVEARVERACDTITQSGARRMAGDGAPRRPPLRRLRTWWLPGGLSTVLEGSLAPTEWLRTNRRQPSAPDEELERRAREFTTAAGADERERYRCQATELLRSHRAASLVGFPLVRPRGRRVGTLVSGASPASPSERSSRRYSAGCTASEPCPSSHEVTARPRATCSTFGPGERVRVRSKGRSRRRSELTERPAVSGSTGRCSRTATRRIP